MKIKDQILEILAIFGVCLLVVAFALATIEATYGEMLGSLRC